ncbi:hypothetical protein DPMN_036556 [Dreissena polymorpha]|uniref:Uncharacterized protein n=1 Tax=Dreissena polymorpha TaxID=45954 RepID=A0A9D4MAX3_DREPO|nr:hypothetical protein DPMN_036556 [Dreissena polymorpha]
MTGAICSAVFVKCDKYFLFDFHSHGPDGLSPPDGKAALATFNNLEDLVLFLYSMYTSMHINITGETELLPVGLYCETDHDCCETYVEDPSKDYMYTNDDIGVVKAHSTWTVGEKNVNKSSVSKQRMSHQTENNTLCNEERFPHICTKDNSATLISKYFNDQKQRHGIHKQTKNIERKAYLSLYKQRQRQSDKFRLKENESRKNFKSLAPNKFIERKRTWNSMRKARQNADFIGKERDAKRTFRQSPTIQLIEKERLLNSKRKARQTEEFQTKERVAKNI